MLHKEMLRSTDKAIRASREWMRYNELVNATHGGSDTAEARIAKKNHLGMKDAMSSYEWHRDHAMFCSSVLNTLAMYQPEGNEAAQAMEQAADFMEDLEERRRGAHGYAVSR